MKTYKKMFSTRCWEVNRTIIEPRGVYAGLCSKGLNIFPCHGRGGGGGGEGSDPIKSHADNTSWVLAY